MNLLFYVTEFVSNQLFCTLNYSNTVKREIYLGRLCKQSEAKIIIHF